MPLLRDPLRRVRVPRDLKAITTVGTEVAPEEGGLDGRTVEGIWTSVRELYRSGVRIMQPETIRRAVTEQSRLEIDLSLGFPTRFSYGMMLGAKVLSL